MTSQQEAQDQFRLGDQEEVAELPGKKGVEAWSLDPRAAGQGVESSLLAQTVGEGGEQTGRQGQHARQDGVSAGGLEQLGDMRQDPGQGGEAVQLPVDA